MNTRKPSVLIVGGCDVHKRIDLMQALRSEFDIAAAGSETKLAEKFAKSDLPFVHFPLTRGGSPLSDLRSVLALRRLFRQRQPDIVHAFATKPAVWGRLAARAAGVPVVIGTIPGLGSLYTSNSLRTRLLRSVYQRLQRAASHKSDFTVFQNESDARQFISAGITTAERSTVIPGSGVRSDIYDPERYPAKRLRRLRRELRIPEGAILVTMISRLIRSKGVLEFAEVARIVRQRYENVRFLLVGPDDRDSLERLTSSELSRVCESVRWVGERTDISEILATSDIFVLPSYYREGIPRSLLEAGSMGLPLVAAKTPGCEDVIVPDENGFLVPQRDVRRLVDAVARLVEQPLLRLRLAQASRRIAVTRFDLSVIASQTAHLYWTLLDEARLAESARKADEPTRALGAASL